MSVCFRLHSLRQYYCQLDHLILSSSLCTYVSYHDYMECVLGHNLYDVWNMEIVKPKIGIWLQVLSKPLGCSDLPICPSLIESECPVRIATTHMWMRGAWLSASQQHKIPNSQTQETHRLNQLPTTWVPRILILTTVTNLFQLWIPLHLLHRHLQLTHVWKVVTIFPKATSRARGMWFASEERTATNTVSFASDTNSAWNRLFSQFSAVSWQQAVSRMRRALCERIRKFQD